MKPIFALLIAALFLSPSLARGTYAVSGTGKISGRVEFEKLTSDAKALPDASGAVVYLVGFNTPPPKEKVRIFQKNKSFDPKVAPIVKGQEVVFVNADKVRHNVFSVSRAKSFDLGIAPPGDHPETQFGETGKIDVYCNIHPEMAMTVLVLPNSAYAVTKPDGSYTIEGLPTGDYTVYAWHRLGAPSKQTVKVADAKVTRLDWKIRLDQTVKPHFDKNGRPYKKRDKYQDESEQ